MDPGTIVTRLCQQTARGPGTDAERRATVWLRDELIRSGWAPRLETAWVRPHWYLVHALHAALGVAGSALSVWDPVVGLCVLSLALVSMAGDLTGRLHLLRLLTPRRATQNLVCEPERPVARRVRLVITANLDAGREGAAYAEPWAGLEARLRHAMRGHLPSMLGLVTGALSLLVITAIARVAGGEDHTLGAIALAPTVLCLIALATLIDIALSDVSPGAGTNASGVAVALELTRALRDSPPRQLDVELVLTGAGEGPDLGLAAYVAARRGRRAEEVVVLALGPCGQGRPRWLTHDGPLWPLRYHPNLIDLCQRVAARESHLGARGLRSHGSSGAFPARRRRWPAIALGARDERDRVPHAHTAADTPNSVGERAMGRTLELALALVGALDEHLAQGREPAPRGGVPSGP